ncbi:hypothetical protein N7517_007433 [Penicillium concentricum]|uniref:Uncharacterized protein n=1 Tax=Penicillium concentricum TaxID=293559 RepID=A0A9W9SB58_9EURO|nr:uncharacterized protein N7517_007433 [Penicillium concentricum]KAJ5375427.1 hypothetical protein N7517_007433 [Penicillium concentricum]
MDRETFFQSFANQQSAQAPLVRVLNQYLSVQEAVQILEQFQSNAWIPNGQVLWSGIPREKAQEWADRHGLQTLTTAMGPLMDTQNPNCLRLRKGPRQWSNYIHGASAIFAWRIAQGDTVTLLSPPPPERFHPSGLSYYQAIEEPIIRGLIDQKAVHKINIAHPMSKGSDEFLYELWPNDRSDKWRERFGSGNCKIKWREVSHSKDIMKLKGLVAFPEQRVCSIEQYKQFEEHEVAFIKPAYRILLLSLFLLILSRSPILILLGLVYSLFDKTWNENNAKKEGKMKLETAEATSIMISPEIPKVEQSTKTSREVATWQNVKDEKKTRAKAQKEAAKKQQEATKKLKDKRKARAKAKQEAAKKLKDEKKARVKAQKKAAKKLKAKKKKKAKKQQEAAKKQQEAAKKQQEAAKKQQEATKKLKDERKARAKAKQEAAKKLKDEKKARVKAQKKAAKKLKAGKKARAKAKQEAAKKLKDEKKARVKAQKKAAKKLKAEKKARAKAQKKAAKKLKDKNTS